MRNENKLLSNKMSSPRNGRPAGFGDLPLTWPYHKKEFSLFHTAKSAEDSRQRHSGMTALFNAKAFTLIELLVVVLIIGILAAVAVPQYQKAVMKSRMAGDIILISSVINAMERYYLANNTYPLSISELDINVACESVSENSTKSNCKFGSHRIISLFNNIGVYLANSPNYKLEYSFGVKYQGITCWPYKGNKAAIAACASYGGATWDNSNQSTYESTIYTVWKR